jgi:beta-lactamase class A
VIGFQGWTCSGGFGTAQLYSLQRCVVALQSQHEDPDSSCCGSLPRDRDHAQAADSIAALRKQMEQAVTRARGDVGVAVKHVESGTEILINADKKFPMASTYKLPVLVEIFYQASEGKLSLDDRIDVMPSDIHIGGGTGMVALFDPPGVTLNIRNLINMAMRISDNSAADILLNRVEAGNVTHRMKALGLESIRVDRSTLEMIMDQSGLDYAQQASLPARDVRKLIESVDPATAAKADDRFNKTGQRHGHTCRHESIARDDRQWADRRSSSLRRDHRYSQGMPDRCGTHPRFAAQGYRCCP